MRFWIVLILLFNFSTPAAEIAGCMIFPQDNPWNRDISNDPVDPKSDIYIADINASRKFLHPDFSAAGDGFPFNIVSGNQPLVHIDFEVPSQSERGPYPIPLDAPIEPGDGDRHVLVLDKDRVRLYELFNAARTARGWSCYSGAVFNLSSNALRPDGWTSADGAGLPILPGLVRYDEVANGAITHALRFTVQNIQNTFIHPATHPGPHPGANHPPMGTRLRLKANFDVSHFNGAAKVILTALKTYGMFVADVGSSWYISGATDPRWNDNNLAQLHKVPGSAFEVVRSK